MPPSIGRDARPRQSKRVATGIHRSAHGFTVVWQAHGKQKLKRFAPDTPIERLKQYRRQQIDLAKQRQATQPTGYFVRDVVRFLKRRKGRPSFKSDRAHLRVWVHLFKGKSRWAITGEDCALAVAAWQEAGYSAREIRHRVRLLKELWAALDGPKATTPLDDLDLPKIPKSRPRSVPDTLVREVALELRKHELLGYLRDAKTRARYLVLATTGQRPAQVMRAQPVDVDLERRVWFVQPAKGDRGAIVYLNDDMLAAWQVFVAAKAWGKYDSPSFSKTLHRCGWPTGIRPYALRHSVGLSLSELGVDLGDIQAHMGHTDINTTRQFYVPTVLSRLKDASERLEGRLGVVHGAGNVAALPRVIGATDRNRRTLQAKQRANRPLSGSADTREPAGRPTAASGKSG